jgi:hypothetical protein
MFTIRQATQDMKILEKFTNREEGFVIVYHEQPKWTGVWHIYETPDGPQNMTKMVDGVEMSILDDILICDSMEEARNLYSPFAAGTVDTQEKFQNGLLKLFKYREIMMKYMSVGVWKVRLGIQPNDKPTFEVVK